MTKMIAQHRNSHYAAASMNAVVLLQKVWKNSSPEKQFVIREHLIRGYASDKIW